MSVLDFKNYGASVALRSFSRVGSALSVLAFVSFGSSMSLRTFLRLGSHFAMHGDKMILNDATDVQVAATTTATTSYETANTTDTTTYGTSPLPTPSLSRVLSFSESGGTLHGMWTADNVISSSDARGKTNIQELAQSLKQPAPSPGTPQSRRQCRPGEKGQGCSGPTRGGSLGPLLRSLRPVAYHFKQEADPKHTRFGFIADEIERTLPEVVRRYQNDHGTTYKGVAYQDLVAVLAAILKEQQVHLEQQRTHITSERLKRKGSIASLTRQVRLLSSRVRGLSSRLSSEVRILSSRISDEVRARKAAVEEEARSRVALEIRCTRRAPQSYAEDPWAAAPSPGAAQWRRTHAFGRL